MTAKSRSQYRLNATFLIGYLKCLPRPNAQVPKAGEYVSVSSQADTEQADLARERHEPATALALPPALGAVAARVGGAPMGRGAVRVACWGALAMAASAGVGRLFGTQVP